MKNLLFAFDIGTNSIGWCVLALDRNGEPCRIADIGVRIYADGRDPQSKASLAVARREARSMSRRRDRYLSRRKAILRHLSAIGLMPEAPAERQRLVRETGDMKQESGLPSLNPYALRAMALDEKLPLFHIGRALFHVGQRRGFKSNRKTDRGDNDSGKIALGIRDLKAVLRKTRARTYGEWLATRREDGHVTRLRAGSEIFEGEGYAFYPERGLLEEEFHAIWNSQARHYPDILTVERRDHLFRVMFYQRPLRKPRIGRCAFNPAEERIAKAHPLFQEFRLYKEVNELTLITSALAERKLTLDERNALVTVLRSKREASFATLRKALKLAPDIRFKKESESRQKLKGDEIHAALSDKARFGPQWANVPGERQWQIIQTLRDEEDAAVVARYLKQEFALEGERADAIAACSLPEGYGRWGRTALSAMLEEMKAAVIPEAEAAQLCGYDHARLGYEGEGEAYLPPYQEILERHIPPGSGNPEDIAADGKTLVLSRFKDSLNAPAPFGYDLYRGRITNPTVHIGLNQLRRLTNRLIDRHGKPRSIAVELARDLQLSEEQKAEKNREIARNTREAERRSRVLEEFGQEDKGYNRMLLKLWEELNPAHPQDRLCIYSGRPISISMLFSGEVDVDHILPWSKTLDDGQANRILCLKSANRQKGNRAPADVPEWRERYDEIVARAARLPRNKQWRFAPDAMQRFEEKQDFLARQLTDTQYLARMAREYLECLYPNEEPDAHGVLKKVNHIRVSPGRLTEMLRRNWGLNALLPDHDLVETAKEKNRRDHRHHAIDAAVVGVTTRSLLQRVSSAAARMEGADLHDLVKKMVADTPPWPGFREDLQRALAGITISHKPDHGTTTRAGQVQGRGKTAGRLHNDTAYGITGQTAGSGNPIVVRRKPFLSLEPEHLPKIRDPLLQAELFSAIGHLTEKKGRQKPLQEALQAFRKHHPRFRGIRRVRMVEPLSVIPVFDSTGKAYKGYKGDANYRYDVWETLDGNWHSEVISMFAAHQPGWTSGFHAENPTARRVLQLHKNDMVAYEHPTDGFTIARVVKISKSICFAPTRESGNLKARDEDEDDPFTYFSKINNGLRDIKCRQVRVDEAGRVYDPGPLDQATRPRKTGKRNRKV